MSHRSFLSPCLDTFGPHGSVLSPSSTQTLRVIGFAFVSFHFLLSVWCGTGSTWGLREGTWQYQLNFYIRFYTATPLGVWYTFKTVKPNHFTLLYLHLKEKRGTSFHSLWESQMWVAGSGSGPAGHILCTKARWERWTTCRTSQHSHRAVGIDGSGSEAKAAIQYKPAWSPCREFGESISFAPKVRFQALSEDW